MSISIKLLEDELTGFCKSASLSEDGLRAIIERHGAIPNNNDVITNYAFFTEACNNEKVTEGIIRYLLQCFPNAARYTEEEYAPPLHVICLNKNITRGMVQLLIDTAPNSVSHEDVESMMPLHRLCLNKNLDVKVGLEILKLLIEMCPESVRHAIRDNNVLPIHFAAGRQSPEFCRMLIEAYPGSERITTENGRLPFHSACALNTVATVKYLYQSYRGSIHVKDTNDGSYAIHHAIDGIHYRDNNPPETAIDIVQFLYDCNPNVALQKQFDQLPLVFLHHWMIENEDEIIENQSKKKACHKIMLLLYDALPDAILDNQVSSNNIGEFCAETQTFIDTQLAYARQAEDHHIMTTRDEAGQLPLHKALHDSVTLGSIKLLVKGNPSAISCADNRGMMPLHVACQYHESPAVVEYLIKVDPTSLYRKDLDDNTALHYACRGANHAIITALLTEKNGPISVSKRNAHGQLPIDHLFASRGVSDREGVEYIESIFRLVRAYPATVMN